MASSIYILFLRNTIFKNTANTVFHSFVLLVSFEQLLTKNKDMKKLKILLLLFMVSVITSCSDASDDDLGTSGEGTFTAKVDGSTFTSLQIAVGATVTNGVAAMQGSNSAGEYIRITILNYTGVGTYTTGNNPSNASSISYGTVNPIATWISTFDLGSGTIEITEETATSISGTFSFTGINNASGNTSSKTITEGQFSASLD